MDHDEGDLEAERLPVKHAEMAPGDFSDALVDHLAQEAMAIGNDSLLATVIAIFERQGRPSTDTMLSIAFEAVRQEIAAPDAGRVIATHAVRFETAVSSLTGLVRLAAGEPDFLSHRRIGADPAALLRFFDSDSKKALALIRAMLLDDDERTRADAAHAAEELASARPPAGVVGYDGENHSQEDRTRAI